MEAARLGIQDFPGLGGFSLGHRPAAGLGLPPGCDPWALTGPSGPLSSLSQHLPGFLSHPQVHTRGKECRQSSVWIRL